MDQLHPPRGVAEDGAGVAVLTSGGDAPGMNAAVRAVVRTVLRLGGRPHVVMDGYRGLVDGGAGIRPVGWDDVGAILRMGGTAIGTARSERFREADGRRAAVRNLVTAAIDRLVVIGGDGSLTGLDLLRREWPGHLAALVEAGDVDAGAARRMPGLIAVGLVGSIDNDLAGADSTIGADSALHRITAAMDQLSSTAASHQRAFVVEVMGRRCGHLALHGGLAGDADAVILPESPLGPDWPRRLCADLRAGRDRGERDTLVVLAEGATDHEGNPVRAHDVQAAVAEGLGEDVRITVLGHVQRGGVPSAVDRWASTWLGCRAAADVMRAEAGDAPHVVAMVDGRPGRLDLHEAVARSREVGEQVAAGEVIDVALARGEDFAAALDLFRLLARPGAHPPAEGPCIAVMHAGGLAPGMNAAAGAVVRLAVRRGWRVVGVRGGFPGLRDGAVTPLGWADVEGWRTRGGSELGTSRTVPAPGDRPAIEGTLAANGVDGLVVIGGWDAAASAHALVHGDGDPLGIPVVVVPATIDNNLPAGEASIGSDTALNAIVEAIDRIKQSAGAARRCFVVETMGRRCGYLAELGGLAGGAERVYTDEAGVDIGRIDRDVEVMRDQFADGRRFFLLVTSEGASAHYDTQTLTRIIAAETRGMFDVRWAILGHMQQGCDPSPADRVLAIRLAHEAVTRLEERIGGGPGADLLGLVRGGIEVTDLEAWPDLVDAAARRARDPWWTELADVARLVAEVPD